MARNGRRAAHRADSAGSARRMASRGRNGDEQDNNHNNDNNNKFASNPRDNRLPAMTSKGKSLGPIISSVVNKGINALDTKAPGHVHDKLPFKYHCKAGRAYMWCSCGWSKTQPFCDGSHHDDRYKISNRPLRFECKETKDYWFCQCKQTKVRPFCDGSHNNV